MSASSSQSVSPLSPAQSPQGWGTLGNTRDRSPQRWIAVGMGHLRDNQPWYRSPWRMGDPKDGSPQKQVIDL